jgi:hypothetical protein
LISEQSRLFIKLHEFFYVLDIVTCEHIAKQRLGKLVRNKCAINNKIYNRTSVVEVFSLWFAHIHCWATDMFSVLWSDPRLYNEKTTIIDISVQSSVESQPVK